jgi:hypothetical protein
MKSALKNTASTAAIMSQKATKVADNDKPISNPHNDALQEKTIAKVTARKDAVREIATLSDYVTEYTSQADTAIGRAKAMAIVTLCLMFRHGLAKRPTRAQLTKDDKKNLGNYLNECFSASSLDWEKTIAVSDSVEETWKQACAAFVWLWHTDSLLLTMPEEANGPFAHLGLLEEKMEGKSRWVIALDLAKLAENGAKLDGKVVPKGEYGSSRQSAASLVKYGQELLDNSALYWQKDQGKTLDLLGRMEAYCVAMIAGKQLPEGPALNATTLNRLRILQVQLSDAIEQGETVVKSNTAKAAKMQAEAEKSAEQKAVDTTPKLTAAEKRAAKRNEKKRKANEEKIAAEKIAAEKAAAKITYLKARKAKSTLRTAKRKAA